jgi:AAA15 family ATPase/GTPase
MLIEFSVENYLSFRDRKVLSMEAAGISEHPENTFEAQDGRYKLLKGAVIYGANSSGKSNLIKAFERMKKLINRRFTIIVIPFNRNTYSHQLFAPNVNQPSKFEVIFIVNNTRYRYGFLAAQTKIKSEWLFVAEKNAEKMLFLREGQVIEMSDEFAEGKDLTEKTREDRLFITVVNEFNGSISRKVVEWFQSTDLILGLSHSQYAKNTIKRITDSKTDSQIFRLYQELNLGFNKIDIETRQMTTKDSEGEIITRTIEIPKTHHTKYDKDFHAIDKPVQFDLRSQESDGTNKLFNLSGNLFNSLENGTPLIIDELDSSLHPLIMLTIVRLFHNPKTNPHNAQLIYTTHDTNMLQYGTYRRDQVWFTEKDKYGGTDLYSLVEIKDKPRKDADFEEPYIKGKYGAIPYIGNIEKLFEEWHKQIN